MDAQALRELLEQTDDKLSIFASSETLNKYNFNLKEFLDLISDFLSDEEKIKLFEYPQFMQFDPSIKGKIIGLISDEQIILQIMSNDNIMDGFKSYHIVDIIEKLSDSAKKQLLYNQDFIKKYQIEDYELKDIISSLTDESRTEILMDIDLIKNKLHLPDFQITELVKGLSSEESKYKAIGTYKFESYLEIDILKTCSNGYKIGYITERKNGISKLDIIDILQTLDIKTLSEFLIEHKKFVMKKGIHTYEIVQGLDTEHQKEFVENLESMDLELNEKREILATLSADVKQSIDTSNLSEEYKSALSMVVGSFGQVILDLERNLEDYQGLDNLITVNPENFTEEQRTKFMKVCDICPNLKVDSSINGFVTFTSTANEYKEAEEWVSSIIDNLNPDYSKAQKIAVIDNAIGKKISYSPDFDTEVFDINSCRALYKIISSGYGVCNGIAKVEQYMFNRVGIESEIISSGKHTFLKVKDIELLLANGEIAKGNTILDPTWNLASHRFGGKPDNFFISYEQARKNDIDGEGKDHNCHKNDEELQDCTIGLDEQSLRNLFTSVGLADKDGKFPISILQEKSKLLDAFYANEPERNINAQFLLLKQTCPEFATCQNSTMRVLSDVLLNNENLKLKKCVVNRVYSRADEEKRSVLYVYINSDELGKRFYFADKNLGQFIELQQEEFVKQFECYERDLEQNKRI